MHKQEILDMTITKQIPAEQMRSLDLHQGDSLRIVAEMGATFLIQIVKAAAQPPERKKGGAGAWAHKYAGAAKGQEAQKTEEVRMAHFQEKYGV